MPDTMTRSVLTALLILLFQWPVPVSSADHVADHVAEKGILGLGFLKHSEDIFSLTGEWEFYWKELLLPGQFDGEINPDTYGKVPSYWHSYTEVEDISRFGFGTYRLIVILPFDMHDSLSLKIPIFDSSYDLFLNGEYICGNGKVDTSRTLAGPGYLPHIHSFYNTRDTLEIVVHVSNYSHRSGGFWMNMQLGKKEAVLKQNEIKKVVTYGLTGILIGAFFLFMTFYILERENRSFLFFSISTLGMLLRLLNTGLYPSVYLFDQSWIWTVRLEYIGTYLAFAFGVLYLNGFYPSKIMDKIVKINTTLFLLFIVIVTFTMPSFSSYLVFVLFILIPPFLAYFLFCSFKNMLKGRLRDTAFFVSLLLVFLAAINDVLVSQSLSPFHYDYLLAFTFIVLIAVQVLILITDWINNYREKSVMHAELQHVNRNLENIIDKRTDELTKTNDELRNALEIKNRMYSIIAHDLKSPVATLAQYADLMMEKFSSREDARIIYELKKTSTASVDLIDNMLHWGMKQENHLQYQPEMISVAEVVHDLMKLANVIAKDKNISLELLINEELAVFGDISLLKIVLRNVITNAIKFTPDNGTVTIRGEEQENQVVIEVTDTGVGMDNDRIEKILAERIEPTRGTSGERGTGLGLLVVKDLTKINKGTLQIKSKPGRGTSVIFTLPGKP
jgi:signal transduction histidine kinase